MIADGVKTPDMVRDLANAYYYTADYQSANKWYADYIDAADTLNVTAEYYYRYAQTLRTMREYDKSNQMMEVFLAKQKNDPRAVIFKSNKDYMKKIEENSGKYEPVVFIKRNNHKPLVVVDADYFINLHKNT